MTITQAVTEWEGIVGKNFTAQSLISQARKLLIYKVTVTFDYGQNYVTGGNLVDLLARGAKTIVAAICINASIGVVLHYDIANGAMKMYESGTTGATLDELASADTLTQSAVFEILVFAQT